MADAFTSTTVFFSHPSPLVGDLAIENGLDIAEWAYNLNAVTFPTYGGEVVQILSVYIDNLSLSGTLSTYSQAEAVYSYFASYFQIATQGKNPAAATSGAGVTAYNMQPMTMSYPQRGWNFQIFPMSAPGFTYDAESVVQTWQMQAFVYDDSANSSLTDVKDALAQQAIATGMTGLQHLRGEISPSSGDPSKNAFQTYQTGTSQATSDLTSIADYYNTLLPYPSGSTGSSVTGSGPAPAAGGNHNPSGVSHNNSGIQGGTG